MLSVCRTDYFIRILVMTTMVWGFALPIAHLVCGMTEDSEAIPCDAHAVTDGTLHAAGHDTPAVHTAHAAHDISAVAHKTAVRNMHNAHTDVQMVRHEAARHGSHDPCPTPEFDTSDARVECCWVEANALERCAPLPSLTHVQDLTAALTGVAPIVEGSDIRAINRTTDAGSSQPVAFRLLFSVFLI